MRAARRHPHPGRTMLSTPSLAPTLVDRLWPADQRSQGASGRRAGSGGQRAALGLGQGAGAVLLVPMTPQTAIVFLLGIAYGWRLAAATVLLYTRRGAAGLPVFAGTPEKGIGLPYMLGPTGGYLAGFVAAAAITGWVAERARHWLAIGARVLAGTTIYLLGASLARPWWAPGCRPSASPFLLGDAVKLALVTAPATAGSAGPGRVLAPTAEAIIEAAAALRRGRLVAFPTETVYGLGAAATSDAAVAAVYRAKAGRRATP